MTESLEKSPSKWPITRPNILDYTSFYLVGIKGVAMTSLAQCLLDAGKEVKGSDVVEEFVTQPLLEKKGLDSSIDTSFTSKIPEGTDCLIYTSAHGAQHNPQVIKAKKLGIPVFTQAEAIASIANQKKVIAVCGVGGKSTVSAMITWILTKVGADISYSVGVGEIPGLPATGKWTNSSEYFVVEADEYVTEPIEARSGEQHVPRFAYLHPHVIVCTNLKFDHPDVYTDFEHTKQTYLHFFEKLSNDDGLLIVHGDDATLLDVARASKKQFITFGTDPSCNWIISHIKQKPGKTIGTVRHGNTSFEISLQLPGNYNLKNALAAVVATTQVNQLTPAEVSAALTSFASTKRRAELIGTKNGVLFYDDYAHHPQEIESVIQAFLSWYPNQRIVFAFQPHTYSRTKELYTEFIASLSKAPEVILTDIFASARESEDTSISSKKLASDLSSHTQVIHLNDNATLANWISTNLKPGDVFVTLGAGNIYQVHELIQDKHVS